MSIRCWCARVFIALTMMLAFGTAVQAQVDPSDLPQTLALSSREDCTALRACLADPMLRSEVEACFSLGPIRQFDFRLFFAGPGARIYMGRMVFSSGTAGLSLSFVYRTGADSLLGIATNLAPSQDNTPLIPDLEAYDFVTWLFEERLGSIGRFAEANGILSLYCQHATQRAADGFTAEFRAGEVSWDTFGTSSPLGQKSSLSVSASYSPVLGYFDIETD